MPKTIILEDGTEIEIPTDEEKKEAEEKSKAIQEAHDKLQKEKEELIKKNEELSADEGNRHWSGIRKANERMKAKLRDQGLEINEEGEIKQKQEYDPQQVQEIAKQTVNTSMVDSFLEQRLAGLSDEDRKTAKHQFGKLTAGEKVDMTNANDFLQQALNSVSIPSSYGGNPMANINAGAGAGETNKKQSFAETEEGKGLAASLGLIMENPNKK